MKHKTIAPPNNQTRARLKAGIVEIEFEGSEEFVQRNWDKYTSNIASLVTASDRRALPSLRKQPESQLPLFDENGTPATSPSDGVPQVEINMNGNHSNHIEEIVNLPTFYRRKFPKNHSQNTKQVEILLAIVYYHQKHQSYQCLSYDDCDKAYIELEPVGIQAPSNMRQLVKRAVEQKYLYKPARQDGKFALTDLGMDFVEQLGEATKS